MSSFTTICIGDRNESKSGLVGPSFCQIWQTSELPVVKFFCCFVEHSLTSGNYLAFSTKICENLGGKYSIFAKIQKTFVKFRKIRRILQKLNISANVEIGAVQKLGFQVEKSLENHSENPEKICLLICLVWSGAKVRKSTRFWNMLQNEYFPAKKSFDTAEKEPRQVRWKTRARQPWFGIVSVLDLYRLAVGCAVSCACPASHTANYKTW